jgi:hypothetical protein
MPIAFISAPFGKSMHVPDGLLNAGGDVVLGVGVGVLVYPWVPLESSEGSKGCSDSCTAEMGGAQFHFFSLRPQNPPPPPPDGPGNRTKVPAI